MKKIVLAMCCITTGLLFSCHRQVVRWDLVDPQVMLQWQDHESLTNLSQAISYQLQYLRSRLAKDPAASLQVAGKVVYLSELAEYFTKLNQFIATNPNQDALMSWMRQNFEAHRYVSGSRTGKILVTSYYVGEYNASLTADERFRFPIYPLPKAARKQIFTDYTREQIDYEKALENITQPIAWLDDDLERYLLHVQGSGILMLKDGSRIMIGYAGSNGKPYVALGSLLKQDEKITREKLNLSGIRNYFHEHPEEFERFARQMPRYIFFQIKPFAETSIGVPVTDLRTIAVDNSHIPYGSLAFLHTQRPKLDEQGNLQEFEPLSLLVVAQDSGSAIKGAHIDLFWGMGESAKLHAGYMKQPGEIYILLPKVDSPSKSDNPLPSNYRF